MDLNNFVASLYDPWFDYTLYKNLVDEVYSAYDFRNLGFCLIIVSILCLVAFYKLWDPVKKPRFKWWITLLFVGLFMFGITNGLLYNNAQLLSVNEPPSIDFFILQMAIISFLYGVLLSGLLSILVKYISVGNKHNPF